MCNRITFNNQRKEKKYNNLKKKKKPNCTNPT